MSLFFVAADTVREALARRWILGLLTVLTLLAVVLGLSLRMEVVDGALAGTRLFGDLLDQRIQAVDVAMRPVLVAGAYTVFYGGLAVGILACSDFAPELLTPGRIEHVLALPVRRSEVLFGTYLGVLCIALLCTGYATGLFTVLLGWKAGLWSWSLVLAGIAACLAFAAVYAMMLASAVFVRSAALSAAVGGVFVLACSWLTVPAFAALFDRGTPRDLWLAGTGWLPRLWVLGEAALQWSGLQDSDHHLLSVIVGTGLFGVAVLSLVMWHVERRDF